MLKIILLALIVLTLKYTLLQPNTSVPSPQRSFKFLPSSSLSQNTQLSIQLNVSSWLQSLSSSSLFLSTMANGENSQNSIHAQQVLSNHPSNNYHTISYDDVQNTTSKTIIEKQSTTISLNHQMTSLDNNDDDDDGFREVANDGGDGRPINNNSDFCRTKQCVLSASKMERLIDWKVDPCENFYNFACGKFIRDSTLHDRRDSLNVFTMTDDKLKDQLRRLFTRKIESDEIEPYKIVKRLFISCLDTDSADARGIEPLKNLITAVGGWPMLNDDDNIDWNEGTWDLEDSIMKLRAFAGSGYTTNVFRGILKLRQLVRLPTLGRFRMDDDFTAESAKDLPTKNDKAKAETIVKAYRSYLIDIVTMIGVKRDSTTEVDIDDAIAFHVNLIKLNSRYDPSNSIENTFAFFQNEIYVKYALTQWLDLFQPLPLLASSERGNLKKLNARAFFNAFNELLSTTSKRTLANYFVLRIIGFASRYMTSEMKKRALHYRMELLGVKQREELWKQCVDIITNSLQIAVESMFSQEYFDFESKQTAIDIASRIKDVFERKLLNSWIDLQQRVKILANINKLIARLRFPSELLGDREVKIFYRNLSIELVKYMESILSLAVFNADRRFLALQAGINLMNTESVGVLNYADSSNLNKILFPAGVLQREILSPDRPLYLNFATSGFVIGYIFAQSFEIHQQMHLPSNVSSQIDCLVRQYDKYTDEESGARNNGRDTLQGNIADNGSLKAVYTAYKRWISENGREKSLPALNFSNEQFFWLSFAQLFCSINRPEKTKNLNAVNANSFEKFRVIGSLSNSHAFSKDFNCAQDSPMNPSTKCLILK